MKLNYLSELNLSTSYSYRGYQIGGLSGIDYDPSTGTFIAESDHGANGKSNAIYRFTLSGNTAAGGVPSITFTGVIPLTHDDAESVRYDPNGDGYWYTTESNPPAIYHLHADGSLSTLATPANIAGRYQFNYSFEGSTFTPNGNYFLSMEDSLSGDQTGLTRITEFNTNGQMIGQFVYQLDNLPNIANPPRTAHGSNNGVSDILAVDNTHLLVLERGFDGTRATASPVGVSHNSIRIYEVDLTGAQDVQNITNITTANATALSKTLLFDSADLASTLNTYATKIDNIEGMSWGANTADGHRTLVLVNDDNYSAAQGKTQFITLELDDAACYLPGTMIATPDGEVAVERIEPGMDVLAFDGPTASPCRVIWTGERHVRVGRGSNRIDQYPVRIARDAIGADIPRRDLLVTSEHSICVDGLLIPVRMLVNGTSIAIATERDSYTVHHLETERHTIVSADGLCSESYLDTGNRSSFTLQKGVVALRSRAKSWAHDAAAPLVTDRDRVEPVWRRLADRAASLGFGVCRPPELEHAPSIAICSENGAPLAVQAVENRYIVRIPPGVGTLQLLSRASRPSDVLGPFVDDRRRLGVLVGGVVFRDAPSGSIRTVSHLTDPDLPGWHAREHVGAGSRWTDGCALLRVDPAIIDAGGLVEIEILAGGPYLDQPAPIPTSASLARTA